MTSSFFDDGSITIINGDSFEVLSSLPNNYAESVITDPPYDLSRQQIETLDSEFARIANGKIVFMPPENQWVNSTQFGFWIKPISTKNTSRRYSRFVEMIFFGGNLAWNSERHWSQYTNVFTDLVDGETDHPFEKPLSLMKRLILNHTNPGQIIIDPFCGSGTTLLAAKQAGRKAIGIEMDKSYCELAAKRLFEAK
ncbi:MAG: site-specific DNA-methyltransferase [Chitinophagales bacterium]|jgi:site-specific DNA-methyltransferase (adenine-specific)|nr:site-specific DNA-methyltransferase [Chitinophagales bacterium]